MLLFHFLTSKWKVFRLYCHTANLTEMFAYCECHFTSWFFFFLAMDAQVCRYCGDVFRSKASLRQHEARHSNDGTFICEICKHVFCSKRNLEKHKIRHSEDRPHICDRCGKCFKTYHDLQRHNEREDVKETGIYSCSTCSASFISECELKDHNTKHSGEKRHRCEICGKGFRYKSNMYAHKKIHDNSTFKCQDCSRDFPSKYALKNHTKYHHRAPKVKCIHCNKIFKCQQTLVAHTKRKHSS